MPDCCRLKTGLHKCCAGAHFHVEARHPGKRAEKFAETFSISRFKVVILCKILLHFPLTRLQDGV